MLIQLLKDNLLITSYKDMQELFGKMDYIMKDNSRIMIFLNLENILNE